MPCWLEILLMLLATGDFLHPTNVAAESTAHTFPCDLRLVMTTFCYRQAPPGVVWPPRVREWRAPGRHEAFEQNGLPVLPPCRCHDQGCSVPRLPGADANRRLPLRQGPDVDKCGNNDVALVRARVRKGNDGAGEPRQGGAALQRPCSDSRMRAAAAKASRAVRKCAGWPGHMAGLCRWWIASGPGIPWWKHSPAIRVLLPRQTDVHPRNHIANIARNMAREMKPTPNNGARKREPETI